MPNASVAPTGAEKTALKIRASKADASRTRPDDCRTNIEEFCLDVSIWFSFAGLRSKHVVEARFIAPRRMKRRITRRCDEGDPYESRDTKHSAPCLTCAELLAKVYNMQQVQSIYFVNCCSILQTSREMRAAYAGERTQKADSGTGR